MSSKSNPLVRTSAKNGTINFSRKIMEHKNINEMKHEKTEMIEYGEKKHRNRG